MEVYYDGRGMCIAFEERDDDLKIIIFHLFRANLIDCFEKTGRTIKTLKMKWNLYYPSAPGKILSLVHSATEILFNESNEPNIKRLEELPENIRVILGERIFDVMKIMKNN